VATPEHLVPAAVEDLGRSEAGIDFNAKRFRFGGHPFRCGAERADQFPVVAHQPRHGPIGHREAAGRSKYNKSILCYFRLERSVWVLTPVGKQAVQADRVDDRTRKDMRADFRALFDYDN
jgi:hypothetical protein